MALAILASLLPFYFRFQNHRQNHADALQVGVMLAQYNASIRDFLSDQGDQALVKISHAAIAQEVEAARRGAAKTYALAGQINAAISGPRTRRQRTNLMPMAQ